MRIQIESTRPIARLFIYYAHTRAKLLQVKIIDETKWVLEQKMQK
jgi:hypothetical protein